MGMSRLLTGVLLILTFLLINVVVAVGQDLDPDTVSVVECQTSQQTFEDCENAGKTSFLAVMLQVTVSGIPGMPTAFNAIYVMIGGVLLVTGVLLIVVAFVPTLGH